MRITILSKIDYTGSGLRLCESIRREGIDIDIITLEKGKSNSLWGINAGKTVKEYGRLKTQRRILSSDIIHFKGDWCVKDRWEGFRLGNAKRVYTFAGTLFRRNNDKNISKPVAPLNDYVANYKSAFTPELCYTKDIKLMEFPCSNFHYEFKKAEKFRILHIPSSVKVKGSSYIEAALKLINRADVEIIFKTNIPKEEVLELKKNTHIYIDQMLLPVYGNAAVEAMSMGIPVMNWDENLYPYSTPVIKPFDRSPDMIALEIEKYLDWDRLEKLSKETFEYCKNIHGTVGKRWVEIYKSLLQ